MIYNIASYFKTDEKLWLFCFSRDPAGIVF
jgi:hypothetical protein